MFGAGFGHDAVYTIIVREAYAELQLLKRRRGQRNSTSGDIMWPFSAFGAIASDDLIAAA
ncbi:hypothetical protein [Mesorhizobium dulcispinae]|uniref:hypothetical protein n=1 Tax=Mesorhizobium dulcispinae TaxID=3072316 RepID=UPI002A24A181|nr:hypothetical protein [Mesorhizobium sp. VK23D]MDX8522801.1 hypothetical protein [Mesorhizobium sp. VK23D]